MTNNINLPVIAQATRPLSLTFVLMEVSWSYSVSCVNRTSIVLSQMFLPSMNPSLLQISYKGLGIEHMVKNDRLFIVKCYNV